MTLEWDEEPPRAIRNGDAAYPRVRVAPNGLAADDEVVECLVDDDARGSEPRPFIRERDGERGVRFALALSGLPNGLLHRRIRAHPWHPDRAHPLEPGLMRWP